MIPIPILLVVIVIAVAFSVYDFKYKELMPYHWIFYLGFIMAGFDANGWHLLVLIPAAFMFGWFMYTIKAWEGGDTKALMLYSTLLNINQVPMYMINLSAYGLLYIGILKLFKYKEIPFIPVLSIALVSTLLDINILYLFL